MSNVTQAGIIKDRDGHDAQLLNGETGLSNDSRVSFSISIVIKRKTIFYYDFEFVILEKSFPAFQCNLKWFLLDLSLSIWLLLV